MSPTTLTGVQGVLRVLDAPPAGAELGTSHLDFLRRLGGPTAFVIPGRDPGRIRAVTTLIHGNEPSGLWAIRELLRSKVVPETNLLCVIVSYRAATREPFFTHRTLPGERDLNRCFSGPFDDRSGRLATALLDLLQTVSPEAMIDIHNTSGSGPAYSVITRMGPIERHLASYFSDHVIQTDLRLGTIIEAVEGKFPAITVETGGAEDEESHLCAFEGLERFVLEASIDVAHLGQKKLTVYKHPIRVELREGASVAYGPNRDPSVDVTLRADVDKHNFGLVLPPETLGWLGEKGMEALVVRDTAGRCHAEKFFSEREGKLVVLQPLHLFMLTTNAQIARDDCLFYVLSDEEQNVDYG